MQKMRSPDPATEAVVGFAANERGNGIAYVRLADARARRHLRVGFRVAAPARCRDRAIAYAALTAVSRALCKRGIRTVRFVLNDAEFVDEIATGRGVGDLLAIPYVRLRCVLNAFAKFGVEAGATDDLTQRARAEVALNVAA
jgi:GNAT superfamily N-acetyltransferase